MLRFIAQTYSLGSRLNDELFGLEQFAIAMSTFQFGTGQIESGHICSWRDIYLNSCPDGQMETGQISTLQIGSGQISL